MDILEKILLAKRKRVEAAKEKVPLQALRALSTELRRPGRQNFIDALKRTDQRIRIIAEIKKASPSAGIIRADFEPVTLALDYCDCGADALSIITEEDFFQGSPDFLKNIRKVVHGVPLLRKDFIFDEYQLYESATLGADAVLLIVACLDAPLLQTLMSVAEELNLAVLLEVHSPDELSRARDCDARIIGINNRNLKTFSVDVRQTESIMNHITDREKYILVSESGIKNRLQIDYLIELGVDAVLIGETFMRSESPGSALRKLIFGNDEC